MAGKEIGNFQYLMSEKIEKVSIYFIKAKKKRKIVKKPPKKLPKSLT